MKRLLLVFVLMICFASSVLADGFVFRKAKWGMSMEQIKNSEPARNYQTKTEANHTMLTYSIRLFESDEVSVDYFFENGQLCLIGFDAYPAAMGEKTVQQAADKLISLFTQQYGKDYTRNPESYYWDLPDKQVSVHPVSDYISVTYLPPNPPM